MRPTTEPKNPGLRTDLKKTQTANPTPQQSNATTWAQGTQPLVSTVGSDREAVAVSVLHRPALNPAVPLVSQPVPLEGHAMGGDITTPQIGKAGEAAK